MLSAARFFVFALAVVYGSLAYSREINILVFVEAGVKGCESNGAKALKFFVYKSSERRLPTQLSAECVDGGPWAALGTYMISQGFAEKVTFFLIPNSATTAVGQSTLVRDQRVVSAIEDVKRNNVNVDYAFWQEATPVAHLPAPAFRAKLTSTIKSISLRLPIGKWLISYGTPCSGGEKTIIAAQREVARNPIFNRFEGPDLGLLSGERTADGCLVANSDNDRLALLWLQKIASADAQALALQKETLLYYFR